MTMRSPLPVFAESSVLPVFEVRQPSLAASVPTAMVLVDYALGGNSATPTTDIQVFAQRVPSDLAAVTRPLRAALAHGTSLREVMLGQLPADHPSHIDWPALRDWLGALGDGEVAGLIEYGIHANLAWGDPTVVMPSPSAALVPRMETAERRRLATAILADWGVFDPEGGAAELVDQPSLTRSRLVELLKVIWDGWLSAAWAGLAQSSPPAGLGPRPALSGSQWLASVTGLRPDVRYAEAADQAERLVVMACPGLGQALTMFDVDETRFVLYSPPAGRPREMADAVALTDLGSLSTVLTALGDPTRLSIVLQLIAGGPLTMSALTEVTGVHQTTVSRQVAALRKARLVKLDEQRRVVLATPAIEDACHTLLTAIQRPADPAGAGRLARRADQER